MMSTRSRLSMILCLGIAAILLVKPGLKFYDNWRLARFTDRITVADHIVATHLLSGRHDRASFSVTLTGSDVGRVVEAVSSARTARPPWGLDYAASYGVLVTFLRGTEPLGNIGIGGSLFILERNGVPFRDDSGVLDELIGRPVSDGFHAAEMNRLGFE
jgi:hypothetical protein